MARAFAEIAFTDSVRAEQERKGSAKAYSKLHSSNAAGGDRLGPNEADFIAGRDGFYQATVSSSGWPYVQFRGGPPGFVKVVGEQTIAYADYRGNRQYISVGNLAENDRISIIFMDYPTQQRLKVWGTVEIFDHDTKPEFVARLHDPSYPAKLERGVVITVKAFDWNCPQHIPQRFTVEQLEPHLKKLRDRIDELSAENRSLKGALARIP